MEAWNLQRYELPYLDVRAVRFDRDTNELIVHGARGQFVIEGDADNEVVDQLEALRSPASPLWREILGGGTPAWRELLQQMDYLGLLRDAASPPRAEAAAIAYLAAIDAAVSSAATWIEIHAPEPTCRAIRSTVSRLFGHVGALVGEVAETTLGEAHSGVSVPLRTILGLDDFYVQIVMIQALYQRRSAPASLAAGLLLLVAVADAFGVKVDAEARGRARRVLVALAGGAYALAPVRHHLDSLASFVVQSAGPDAKRTCMVSFRSAGTRSGLDFMLDVERVAAESAAHLGTPRYLAAVSAPDAPLALAQGAYLQEWHVTSRFVEILTPMLAKRLTPALRKRMFRYYAEELGHETFEYDACRSLGLSHDAIEQSEPMSLHVAYVDLFTHLAETDPVAFFASLFITEGVLGEEPPLEEPLRKLTKHRKADEHIAARHSALNAEYNHTSLSRLFLYDVATVSEALQEGAIAYMLLLLELNYRAWDALLERYGCVDPWTWRGPTAFAGGNP